MAVRIFPVAPRVDDPSRYLADMMTVARFSDQMGLAGILLFTGNDTLIDPWCMAQYIVQHTKRTCPLVAVNPLYAHPFTVVKYISSLAQLYKRKIFLNMVTGTATSDLRGLGDRVSHDERYRRLEEFMGIVQRLLSGPRPVSFKGMFYEVDRLQLLPKVDAELMPEFLIAGQSDGARRLIEGSKSVGMQMLPESLADGLNGSAGVNMGILARAGRDEAWAAAHKLFPTTTEGRVVLAHTMKNTESIWKQRLNAAGSRSVLFENGYWLGPFMNYQADCPYLVGSYAEVSSQIRAFAAKGINTIILDVVPDQGELAHIHKALELGGVLEPSRGQPGLGRP